MCVEAIAPEIPAASAKGTVKPSAMPITAPGTLTPDETYAVVAWLLAENEIIPRDAEMNAKTLPAVKMPAAGRFVVDDRAGKTVK